MDSRTAAAALRSQGLDLGQLLEDAIDRFATALGDGDPAAVLPGTGGWTVTDLAEHLATIHRWSAAALRSDQRPEMRGPVGPDGPGPASVGRLVQDYRDAAAELLAGLAVTDPDQACWTLDRADRRAGFWWRRQLHETVVHLWDLRSVSDPTTGALADLPVPLLVDAVDEFLHVFPCRLAGRVPDLPGPLVLRLTDEPRAWRVEPGWRVREVGSEVVTAASPADASVEGPSAAMLLHVWGRSAAGVRRTGSPAVHEAFEAAPCRG